MITLRHVCAFCFMFVLVIPTAFGQEGLNAITADERAAFEEAYFAWDEGDYIASLETLETLLQESENEALHARIAQLTGELHPTQELADDGRDVVWGPTGGYGAYTTGDENSPILNIFLAEGSTVEAAQSVDGESASFSPDGLIVAFLRTPETSDIQDVRQQEAEALEARNFDAVRRARSELLHLEAEAATIHLLDLESGEESRISLEEDIRLYDMQFGIDGALYLIGGRDDALERTQIFRTHDIDGLEQLTKGGGLKGFGTFLTMGGQLIWSVDGDSLAVLNPETREETKFRGSNPAISADGQSLVFLQRESAPEALQRGEAQVGADVRSNGRLTSVHVAPLSGEVQPQEVLRTTLPLQHAALSPTGDRVTYSKMLRDSWDVFVADVASGKEDRITREIQHEYYPQFMSDTEVMTLFGEARHRRAYLYDLDPDSETMRSAMTLPGADERGRVQLFHNNTLRTIAPQYEWAMSPTGNHLLVVAHRDGDTVAPENSVHLVDLTQPVSRDDLLSRVRQNLVGEHELRDRGREMFTDIADEVRAATQEISVGRAFDHAHALYQLDSKWFEEEGNQRAIEYLTDSFEQMGYEVEQEWFEPRDGSSSANIVATLEGVTNPDQVYMITSHFDSVPGSPGSDDNSSGTVAMLEVARVLADRPQHATIKFVLLTAEEAGLLGAYENAARLHDQGVNVAGVINNDMVGWTRSHRLDNTIRYSNAIIRDIQHAAAIQFSDLITYDARYVRGTDAYVYFEEFGDILGGIGSYPVLSNPHYHQPHDVLEVQNHRLVTEVSRATTAAIMRLASTAEPVADLEVSTEGQLEVSWTGSREANVSGYAVTYGPDDDPHRYKLEVDQPRADLDNAEVGWRVQVQPLTNDGVPGWGVSRKIVPARTLE